MKSTCGRTLGALLSIVVGIAPVIAAPQAGSADPVAQAQRFRDTGNFAAAADLLRNQLAQKPDNGEIARLLAQTLYWLKDIPAARAVYEKALVQHPEDTTLRLQYGRMLAETGERERARELLKPLLSVSATKAEAETLLGELSYWDGDLSTARRQFETALLADPKQEEAKSKLAEIVAGTAPWIRVSSVGWHDNQPLDRLVLGLESGWFVTPLTKLTASAQPTEYWTDSSHGVAVAEVALSNYKPAARLETELALGAVRHVVGVSSWDWTGRGRVGFRLPKHLTVSARLERAPYFATRASLDTSVMVQTMAGVLHWSDDARGWLGEAAYQRQRYPDNNAIRTSYGWLLAPLIHRTGVEVQAGYSLAASNADALRYVLAQPNQTFNLVGEYAPYYTPSHLVTHSALAGFTLGNAKRSQFRFDASYGFRSTDDAPFFSVSGGKAVLGTFLRKSSPWDLRTSIKLPLRPGLTLEPTAEVGRTIFYSWATAGLQVTYRGR